MKVKYYLFVIMLLALSSCDSGSGNGELKKDLYQGTSGVEFEIFDLPSEVSEDEEIPLIFRVENKGPYVTKGRIVINTEKDYVNIKESNVGGNLKKHLKGLIKAPKLKSCLKTEQR